MPAPLVVIQAPAFVGVSLIGSRNPGEGVVIRPIRLNLDNRTSLSDALFMTSLRDSVPRAGSTGAFLFVKDGEAETGFFITVPFNSFFSKVFLVKLGAQASCLQKIL
jgi:hypothetical protein